MAIEKINSAVFDEKIYDEGEACLVMFTRKDCHVCQGVHPKIEELAEDSDYEDNFGFYEVDVEEQENLFRRFSLKGVPQVLFFKDGDFAGVMTGDNNVDEYADKIDELIA